MDRRVFVVAGVTLLGLFGLGCNRPQADPVTLTFWHTFNAGETEVVNARLEAFQKVHPEIRVRVNVLPYGSAQSRVREAYLAGNAPDVFRMETAWTSEFVELGIVSPASQWLTEEERADLLPQARELFVVDDELWGAPQVVDCLALLYNRDIVSNAPTTYDELVQVAKEKTDPTQGRHGLFVRGDAYWFLPVLWGHGGDLMREDEVVLDDDAAVRALERYVSLAQTSMSTRRTDWAMEYRRMMRVFGDGRAAMIFNGPWSTVEILESDAFDSADQLGIAAIPGGPQGAATPIGGHAYAINASTPHAEAAAALVRWLYDTPTQVEFAEHANVLPTRRSAYEDPRVSNNRIVQEYRSVLDTGRMRPGVPEMAYVLATFSSALQSTLDEEMTAEAALGAVARQWRERRGRQEETKP